MMTYECMITYYKIKYIDYKHLMYHNVSIHIKRFHLSFIFLRASYVFVLTS